MPGQKNFELFALIVADLIMAGTYIAADPKILGETAAAIDDWGPSAFNVETLGSLSREVKDSAQFLAEMTQTLRWALIVPEEYARPSEIILALLREYSARATRLRDAVDATEGLDRSSWPLGMSETQYELRTRMHKLVSCINKSIETLDPPPSPPINLYHYCSSSTFHSIITGKKLRLSDLSLSNDALEGQIAVDRLFEACREANLPEALISFLERLAVGYANNNGYGLCLSEEPDLLSQWRGYADDGHGFCIGLSVPDVRSLTGNFQLARCVYDPVEHRSFMTPLVSEIARITADQPQVIDLAKYSDDERDEFFKARTPNFNATSQDDPLARAWTLIGSFAADAFHVARFHMKGVAFREEREWRLISHGAPSGFNPARNRIVPYQELDFSEFAGAISSVIIGPKNITSPDKIDLFLKGSGLNCRSSRSSATYR